MFYHSIKLKFSHSAQTVFRQISCASNECTESILPITLSAFRMHGNSLQTPDREVLTKPYQGFLLSSNSPFLQKLAD